MNKVGDIIEINFLLSRGLQALTGDAHMWAFLTLRKIKPIVEAYDSAIKVHEDYDKYNNKENMTKTEDELKKLYPEYYDYFNEQKEKLATDHDENFCIKPIKAKWLIGQLLNPILTSLFVRFDLVDDLEALEKLMYEGK